ncbi:MAG: K(+)-transporting ATPase subunit C [Cyanobacteriota bacterium]|nr:K(+)-transporting ATPase subunit C [Cyanobacteriota bacterium]
MREMKTAILATLCFFVLTAVIYPALLLGIGLLVPEQANGSLVDVQGNLTTDPSQAVGSRLVGQPFTQEQYFWGRPSVVNYSAGDLNSDPNNLLKTGISGGSNLAPSNPSLLEQVEEHIQTLQAAGLQTIPADLVYSSGSGLDPHVSPAGIQAQLVRVAEARAITPDQIRPLIEQATEHRFLGLFGDPGVNVLRLNIALDQQFPRS